jgi:excisionase family DNA binding protein
VNVSVKKRLYELPEFAEATGMPLGTVRQYVSRGIIEAVYVGRKRLIKAEILERICDEGLKTPKKQKETA